MVFSHPAGSHRVVRTEVVPGQLLGEDQPAAHAGRPSRVAGRSGRSWRRRRGGCGQLPAAVARRLDGAQERGPDLVVLQLPDGRRGGAAGRGDPLPEHGGVLAGLPQQLGRAEHGLHDQLGGGVPRQPEMDARPRSSPRRRRTGTPARTRRSRSPRPGSAPAPSAPDRSPTGSSVTRSRCSWSLCAPGEIAAIPSSTWAGVLGITRTTGDAVGQPGLDRGGVHPGGQRHHQRPGRRYRSDLAPAGRACPAA